MRSSRLLALLLHLQGTGRATAQELAELAEVSVRTIYRDIAALQAAGIPLWTEPGPGGGVRLLEGWQSHIAGLTADEAGVLALAGVPGAAGDLGLGPALAAAEVKLTAGLDPVQRQRAAQVRARFLLDAPGWYERPETVPHLPVLARATFAGRQVEIRYRAGSNRPAGVEAPRPEPVARRLDPLGLVLKGGTWYLAGRYRRSVRSYRVSRVVAVTERDEPVDAPEDFDLATWWRKASEAFEEAILHVDVDLRVSEWGLRRLAQAVPGGPTTRAVEAARAAGPGVDGWYDVALRVESEVVGCHQLLVLGPEVEVRSPVTLRRALAETARRMHERHS
jgi:predicted DNA-binding transcriptional regulator YafY